tara:strand:- start:299 stop:505 length:207 start_codon:yes stop_codon:yes gene_type:complete
VLLLVKETLEVLEAAVVVAMEQAVQVLLGKELLAVMPPKAARMAAAEVAGQVLSAEMLVLNLVQVVLV